MENVLVTVFFVTVISVSLHTQYSLHTCNVLVCTRNIPVQLTDHKMQCFPKSMHLKKLPMRSYIIIGSQ